MVSILGGVAGGFANAAERAFLVITSETGMPHAACMYEYGDGKQRWIGFRPQVKNQPIGLGIIDESNRQAFIETYARFEVDPMLLKMAEANVRAKYTNRQYVVGVCDCVSLTADMARECGLRVNPAPNFLPSTLVSSLARDNAFVSQNLRPFPWIYPTYVGTDRVTVRLDRIQCIKTETVTGADKVYVRFFSSEGHLSSPNERNSLNDSQVWNIDRPISTARRGAVFAIQLWDDDTFDDDDLVLDVTFRSNVTGAFSFEQTRGTPVNGSESKYRVDVTIEASN